MRRQSRQVHDERGLWTRLAAASKQLALLVGFAAPECAGSPGAAESAQFIESTDEAGSGGVDASTGRVLTHKCAFWCWRGAHKTLPTSCHCPCLSAGSARRAIAFLAARNAAEAASVAAVASALAAAAAIESPASLVLAAAASAAAAAADSAAAYASAASFQPPNSQPTGMHAAIAIAARPLWDTTTRAIADAVSQASSLDATLSSPSRAQPASRRHALDGAAGPVCSFELIGIDVLPDDAGNMWILEIQRHPSLLPSSPFDQRVKAGAVEAIHALLGAGTKEAIAGSHTIPLPPAWTLCTPTPPVADGGTLPVPMDRAELARWRARADSVALEVASDLYAGECARRELYF